MRMSPRLKARRGRFGPGGLKGPSLSITFPENGAVVTGSPAVPFTGTAFDDLDGDVSANIVWHVGALPTGSPSTGDATGASVNLSGALAGGVNTVTATVVDSGGQRSTTSISVTN